MGSKIGFTTVEHAKFRAFHLFSRVRIQFLLNFVEKFTEVAAAKLGSKYPELKAKDGSPVRRKAVDVARRGLPTMEISPDRKRVAVESVSDGESRISLIDIKDWTEADPLPGPAEGEVVEDPPLPKGTPPENVEFSPPPPAGRSYGAGPSTVPVKVW